MGRGGSRTRLAWVHAGAELGSEKAREGASAVLLNAGAHVREDTGVRSW
jgi:hypothetical protein